MIIKDNKNNKKMVKNFNGKDVIFGTAKEFLDLVGNIGQSKNNFHKGYTSFYCETKEDVEYVHSIISEKLISSQDSLLKEGLPIYIRIDQSFGVYSPTLDKEQSTPFVEKVQDFKNRQEFFSFKDGTFNELAEIPFDENEINR